MEDDLLTRGANSGVLDSVWNFLRDALERSVLTVVIRRHEEVKNWKVH